MLCKSNGSSSNMVLKQKNKSKTHKKNFFRKEKKQRTSIVSKCTPTHITLSCAPVLSKKAHQHEGKCMPKCIHKDVSLWGQQKYARWLLWCIMPRNDPWMQNMKKRSKRKQKYVARTLSCTTHMPAIACMSTTMQLKRNHTTKKQRRQQPALGPEK